MKLSLAWIFDHIDHPITSIDVDSLVARFNQSVAEIESYQVVSIAKDIFYIGQITEHDSAKSRVHILELNQTIDLLSRDDGKTDRFYLLKKEKEGFSWVRMSDLGGAKESYISAIIFSHMQWRDMVPSSDVILDVDNKSITHRPDLWGHRGIAREIAAMYNFRLKPLESMLDILPVRQVKSGEKNKDTVSLSINSPRVCKRIAGTYVPFVTWAPSSLAMAARLSLVDIKPIDALVDATNYVMMDLGQPMHAFDGAKAHDRTLSVRMAYADEKLKLLDGQTIALQPSDCVITDDKHAISLAGVMGGFDSMVTSKTQSLLLESGNFDATIIRKTVLEHKKRTDASSRFEKSLDPMAVTTALQRYLYLLDKLGIVYTKPDDIKVCGPEVNPVTIEVSHRFIEHKLGITLSSDTVIDLLERLECRVSQEDTIYHVTIPSFRETKDLAIKEDIVEEVGRLVVYINIPDELPLMRSDISDTSAIERIRLLKNVLVHGMSMQEVATYAFFDESWLERLGWDPGTTVEAIPPGDPNGGRLGTS